jgi:cyanate permease
VAIYAVFIFGMGLCLANQHSFKQDVLPGQVATVSALVGFCETLFTSFVLSRIGVLVDRSGNYAITTWILIACASFCLLSAIFFLRKKWIKIA